MKQDTKVRTRNGLTGIVQKIGTGKQWSGWAQIYVIAPHRVRGMVQWEPISTLKPL